MQPIPMIDKDGPKKERRYDLYCVINDQVVQFLPLSGNTPFEDQIRILDPVLKARLGEGAKYYIVEHVLERIIWKEGIVGEEYNA